MMGCCIECVRVSGVQEKQYKLPPSGKIRYKYIYIYSPAGTPLRQQVSNLRMADSSGRLRGGDWHNGCVIGRVLARARAFWMWCTVDLGEKKWCTSGGTNECIRCNIYYSVFIYIIYLYIRDSERKSTVGAR